MQERKWKLQEVFCSQEHDRELAGQDGMLGLIQLQLWMQCMVALPP